MRKLLILVPFQAYHMDRILRAVGSDFEIEFHPHGLPEEELRLALADAEVVIGEPAPHLLHETRSVKWVQMTWAGTDLYTRGSLSFPEGMRLTNASGGFGNIISQYVVGQTLSLMQNLPHYRLQQQEDKWADLGPVASLEGATVMIFGAGNIGSEIARRLQGFDCTIMGICRSPQKNRTYFDSLFTLSQAEWMLPLADVVIGCIPNTEETCHFLNEKRLRTMKAGAVLVNVGRGNFIDCEALARVLAEGHLRGAALDVTEPEPLPVGHPLWKEPRCVITPHVSGGSFGRHKITEDLICDICCKNLMKWRDGEPLNNIIL